MEVLQPLDILRFKTLLIEPLLVHGDVLIAVLNDLPQPLLLESFQPLQGHGFNLLFEKQFGTS
jgi:hypothetical protein